MELVAVGLWVAEASSGVGTRVVGSQVEEVSGAGGTKAVVVTLVGAH